MSCSDFFFLLKLIITRNKGQILDRVKKLKTELLNEIPCHLTIKVGYSSDLTWETIFSLFPVCSRKTLIYQVIILFNLSYPLCDEGLNLG